MNSTATLLLVMVLVTTACTITDSDTTITGSGTVATESRDVDSFDRLVVEGGAQVLIEVGPATSLEVQTDDNVTPVLTTEVRDGRLVLSIESGTSLRDIAPIVYRITTPNLVAVEISGSGDVVAENVDTTDFDVDISGSGDVKLVGIVDTVSLNIAGSGSLNGAELIAVNGDVEISGSGYALVNATAELEISISGSGTVEYLGNPVVTQSIAGSGEVNQL